MAVSRERSQSVMSEYDRMLARSGLSPSTRRLYWSRISGYLAWLIDGRYVIPGDDPLDDARARNAAVRDYRTWLRDERGVKPSTINAALTAIDHFYTHLELGPVPHRRENLDNRVPRVLDAAEQERFVDAANRNPSARDGAVAHALFGTGVRVAELVALDIGHLYLGRRARITLPETRRSPGRSLPVPSQSGAILRQWIDDRPHWRNADTSVAAFINRRGGRLSSRSVDDLIAATSAEAGLNAATDRPSVTPQVLRHTYAYRTRCNGASLEQLADLLGHRRLESTRRYLESLTAAGE